MSDPNRCARIAEARLRQPIEELERKAAKAATRSRLWTQEELDHVKARAHVVFEKLHWS